VLGLGGRTIRNTFENEQNVHVVRTLVRLGVDVNAPDEIGYIPMPIVGFANFDALDALREEVGHRE
jgi:hypothetical protein